MAQHNEIGKKGEQIAVDYLVKNGYAILARNFRFDRAEIDIIASKEDIIIAVEVKTRSSIHFGKPEEFVNRKQIQRLVKALDAYMLKYSIETEARFDIVAIQNETNGFKIEHLENAFYHF